MTELVRVDLKSRTIVPDDVPWVAGVLTLPEDTWADLTDRGYPGVGYWKVVETITAYDPATEILVNPVLTVGDGIVLRTFSVVTKPIDTALIRQQLLDLDSRKIRPTSDILLGTGDVPDKYGKTPRQRLQDLEGQAAQLRALL